MREDDLPPNWEAQMRRFARYYEDSEDDCGVFAYHMFPHLRGSEALSQLNLDDLKSFLVVCDRIKLRTRAEHFGVTFDCHADEYFVGEGQPLAYPLLDEQHRQMIIMHSLTYPVLWSDDCIINLTDGDIERKLRALRGRRDNYHPSTHAWVWMHRSVRLVEDIILHLGIRDRKLATHFEKERASWTSAERSAREERVRAEKMEEYAHILRLTGQPQQPQPTMAEVKLEPQSPPRPKLRLIRGGQI